MKGKITIETITRDEHEGLSVQVALESVSLEDRLQLMTALAQALHMPASTIRMWSAMYSMGIAEAMFTKETVYDHSVQATPTQQEERPQAFRDLDALLSELFGGGIR